MTTEQDLGALVAEKDIPQSVQHGLIKRRTERGMTPGQIARLMGLDAKDVKALVKTNGWVAKRELHNESQTDHRALEQSRKENEIAIVVRNLAERGSSRQEVADITGKNRGYINEIARMYDIKFPADRRVRLENIDRNAKYRQRWFYDRIIPLREQGLSYVEVGKELGVSYATVKRCIDFFKEGAE